MLMPQKATSEKDVWEKWVLLRVCKFIRLQTLIENREDTGSSPLGQGRWLRTDMRQDRKDTAAPRHGGEGLL